MASTAPLRCATRYPLASRGDADTGSRSKFFESMFSHPRADGRLEENVTVEVRDIRAGPALLLHNDEQEMHPNS